MRLAAEPIIILITRGTLTADNFARQKPELLQTVAAAAAGGISHIQIREKQLPAKLIYEIAADAVAVTRSTDTKILVNGRFDIAVAAKADGVHLTGSSLPTDVVRRVCPPSFIISTAAHSLPDIAAAKDSGADLALLSPIFATPGKGTPLGLEILADAVLRFDPLPVVGLGGIDVTNFDDVLQTGAAGFAAIRFLNSREGIAAIEQTKR